jgi:imidazolonepropionase
MTSTLFTGISELVTNDPSLDGADHSERLGLLRDAAVVVADGLIEWVGPVRAAPAADQRREVGGKAVLPGFVDSHSHLVFAGDRGPEFAARMTGARYDGGGISRSVEATRAATDDELYVLVAIRVAEMRAQGTTTVEIKSGYGLNVQDEARSLRIATSFTSETTFLGAHHGLRPAREMDRCVLRAE